MQNWYAPSLASGHEAGVQDWADVDVIRFLQTGKSPKGGAAGPMAEVVYTSTQYLSDADARAMTTFLKQLPRSDAAPAKGKSASVQVLALGERLYQKHCAACHGDQGTGALGIYPPLVANRTVLMQPSTNLLRVILTGGFLPSTAGNPRPFGMPPFAQSLNDAEVAAIASYVRSAWGNTAPEVTALDVQKVR
jgi:mono/diheme cytochrome c family protein